MAFGDVLRADGATVVLTADTQQFNSKIDEAERNWRETTATMSRDALKLDLAQQRLKASLAKYGSEAAQTKRATIALKDAEEQAARAANHAQHEYAQTERTLGKLSRGALSGSGAFRGLGRSLAFASGAFLGGTGFVYAVRTSINAAIEQDKILANLRNSLQASGLSWDRYGQQIQDATQKTKALSAFDDEDLFASLQRFIRSTRDVTESLKLNALAADVARGANVSLEQSSKAILRAYNGQTAGLSRLGVSITKGVSGTKALEEVQRHFAGAAEAFGNSAAGATARFEVGLHDLEKAIGRGILPQFTALTKVGADWLNQAENQKRVEHDVATAMQEGEKVVRGLASGFELLHDALGPVVDALGGTEKATRDLFALLAIYKLAKIAFAIRGLGVAFGFVGTSATVAAGEAVAAENAIGTAAVANTAKVGLLARALGGLGGLAGLTGGIAIATGALAVGDVVAIAAAPGAGGARNEKWKKYPRVAAIMAKLQRGGKLSATERQALGALPGGLSISQLSEAQLRALEKALTNADPSAGYDEGRIAGRQPGAQAAPRTAGRSSGSTGRTPRTMTDILLDEARASTTAGTGDDLRYHREAANLLQRQIDNLERRKTLTAKQKERLRGLYDDLASEQSAIQSIVDDGEKKLADQREAAAKKAAAKKAAADKRLEAIIESAERASERHAKLVGDTGHDRASMRRAALRGVKATVSGLAKAKADADKSFTMADFRRESFEFLQSLHGVTNEYGSNIDQGGAGWALHTQGHQAQTERREQTRAMKIVASRLSHQDARYIASAADVVMDGIGGF